jgi:hypothetical protein
VTSLEEALVAMAGKVAMTGPSAMVDMFVLADIEW